MADKEKFVSTAAKFKWTNDMVKELLDSSKEFKATIEFSNLNFNASQRLNILEIFKMSIVLLTPR